MDSRVYLRASTCCYNLERVKIYQRSGIIRLNLSVRRCLPDAPLYSQRELVGGIELKLTRNGIEPREKLISSATKQQMHAPGEVSINSFDSTRDS